ncbi:hypothetical protein LIOPPNJA_28400, partial [Robbsia andropogonis]|uniref:hypothetical protein n=1 Tax=Robbsia andropogonis TaxID=28092 RepID=UPI00209D2F3D
LQAWLNQQADISAVLPNWQVPVQVQGWPADLFGVIDHSTYRQHGKLLESVAGDPWDLLRDEDSVMLSEQLVRRLGARLDDTLN